MADTNVSSAPRGSVSRQTNRYIREVLHASEPPPAIPARFFYTSPLAIDDPLSPLPPPQSGSSAPTKQPPRPFSVYDNNALDRAWHELRREVLKITEEAGAEKRRLKEADACSGSRRGSGLGRFVDPRQGAVSEAAWKPGSWPGGRNRSSDASARGMQQHESNPRRAGSVAEGQGSVTDHVGYLSTSLRALEVTDLASDLEAPTTTGTPFIRAPSRSNVGPASKQKSRPSAKAFDSYNWGDDYEVDEEPQEQPTDLKRTLTDPSLPSRKVPVGVSRLHNVVMPQLQMEPIYWSPVHDIAAVVRGTWFYKESMLPVEVEVANMLEAGYTLLQPWTETWKDELDSAVEVGALGEMKILQRLWPEKPKKPESRPGSSIGSRADLVSGLQEMFPDDPAKEREQTVETAGDVIDIAAGPDGPDNKAAGSAPYGRDGTRRLYLQSGVIYANEKEAYILRPNLQPSAYYGRRPLANYIRKGRKLGVQVVRGFDQGIWDKLHPPKKSLTATKAHEGVSTSQAGAPPYRRQKADPTLAQSERPEVTDLVLVIHGIGQKLSERVESFHFTHAINSFRREVNIELGTDSVKSQLRKDMGGIMVLPVNWRLSLSFEEGGYRDGPDDPSSNQYSLKDITPDTLPSIRNIISDVMLDVPYYLSQEHHPKMIAACVREANRIYRLWCANNPGFAERGRVHLVAHSLGSVMAVDVLSDQPTHALQLNDQPSSHKAEAVPTPHFMFNTNSLFVCGSPVGFFLLLKKASLVPRHDLAKAGADPSDAASIGGSQGTYGCLAVDNIYNVVNPYDPVAYRLNATVDAAYAAALKPAFVPSASASWLGSLPLNPFRGSLGAAVDAGAAVGLGKPAMARLPSNVEMETHNFTREEIAEKRALLLNDNGQIDFFLRYGGGALEIQYLTMLGAHSSYWLSRDFVRMIVAEVGRPFGREGTVAAMRAMKRKARVG